MQLAIAGHPVHTRSLTVVTTLLDDGRWRARGDVIDLRKSSFVPMLGDLQTAGIVHQMSIDVIVDPATRRLESIEVDQPFVAIEPSEESGGECCRDPAERLFVLTGETLDSGFSKRLSAVFGGPRGCSHLLTLFHLMASALPRALDLEAGLLAECGVERRPGEHPFRRSLFLDGFEIDDEFVGVALQLADFVTRPGPAVEGPLQRLALQSDARVRAVVARETLTLRELQVAERERSADSLGSATWRSRDEELEGLVGHSVVGGLADQLFGLLGDAPENRVLLDCMLQLAPGYIQIMATLMESWFSQREPSSTDTGSDPPSIASVGGTPDSCYMWRVGGPLASLRGGEFSDPDAD